MHKQIKGSIDYFVTNTGRVFRKERELKKNKSTNGYVTVSVLYINGERKLHYVHRLVAEAFLPNPENKKFVNHKNLIKNDNRVENLEWVTPKENNVHAHKNGAFRTNGAHHHAVHCDEVIHKICSLIQEGRRTIDIINTVSVDKSLIFNIRKRKAWMHISDLYVLTVPRFRRLSDQTAEWVCKKIVEGKTAKEINQLSEGKVNRQVITDIRSKKTYKDISDKYF